MAVKVKICGVRTPAIIEEAADAGADFIGLVLFRRARAMSSLKRRACSPRIARGKIGTVAVMVDPDDALIDGVVEHVRPDLLQLHGSETPERVPAIKALSGLAGDEGHRRGRAGDLRRAAGYASSADYILFDAKAACRMRLLPGGNGVAFDWQHARRPRKRPSRSPVG